MAGHIVKRGERAWLVRVPLGRDANGKRLFHSKTVHGSKREATRYLVSVQREIDTGTFAEAPRLLLRDFLPQWFTAVGTRVRARTLADYRSLAERYLLPKLGHRRIGDIRPSEIQAVYSELIAQGLSPRTVRYAHSVLHGALEQAVRWTFLPRNVAKLVSLPRVERREMRALTKEEAFSLLAASEGTRLNALWLLLLTTGMRPGEALGAKWSDLDNDRLRIQRALVRTDGEKWQLLEPKTARARRVVTLPASAVRALQSHRVRQNEERLKAGSEWSPYDLIFCTRFGEPLDYRVIVRRYFRPIVSTAGLGALRPYDLRHSCATLLLAAGENVKVVSERLGHANSSLTLDVYSHVLPDMQQRAAERLEAMLFASSASESR